MKSKPSPRRSPRSYRRLFLISLTIWLLLAFSIVGISRWLKERSAPPSPPEKEPVVAEETASKVFPGSETETKEESPQPITEEDRKQAEKVAKKFVRKMVTMPEGDSPEAVAKAVKPYVSGKYYEEIRHSMRMAEPKKIRELTLWPVEPPLLEGGLSYQSVVITEDYDELHFWFSMKKEGDRWIVWRREEGFQ